MSGGTWKDDRQRGTGRIGRGLRAAKHMFFGASPAEKRALRQTKDPRTLKVGDLDLDAIDREKFGAPEKVGESLRLIDIALGEGPPPPGAPPAPVGSAGPPAGARPQGPAPELTLRDAVGANPGPPPRATGRVAPAGPKEPQGERPSGRLAAGGRSGSGRLPRKRSARWRALTGEGPSAPEEPGVGALAGTGPRGRGLERVVLALALLAPVLGLAAEPIARELDPTLAVDAAARRPGLVRPAGVDPWGRPFVLAPAGGLAPTAGDGVAAVGTRATTHAATHAANHALRSVGPDGVDQGGGGDDVVAAPPDRPRHDPRRVRALALAGEAGVALGLALAWAFAALRASRPDRRRGALRGLVRLLVIVGPPGAVAAVAALWGGGALTLAWPAPVELVEVHRRLAPEVALRLPQVDPARVLAGAWAGLALLLAVGWLRLRR